VVSFTTAARIRRREHALSPTTAEPLSWQPRQKDRLSELSGREEINRTARFRIQFTTPESSWSIDLGRPGKSRNQEARVIKEYKRTMERWLMADVFETADFHKAKSGEEEVVM